MNTFFYNGKKFIPYIPEDIFERDQDSAVQDEGNIVYCCNWMNYAYHMVGDETYVEFRWVHEATDGFSFSTYHRFDEEFLDLLEAVRAINRFDGNADLLAFSSYEYNISFHKLDTGYIAVRVEPQDDSYHWNIKAFYDPVAMLSNLRDQAFRSARLPDANECVTFEFACESESERVYFPWISADILEYERLRYDISTDTYRFSASVGMVDAIKENYIYLHWRGMENSYNIRVENTESFRHLLARIGVINDDGTIYLENDELYRTNFEIILRRIGSVYECVNLRLLHDKTDGYWHYLMRLAEEEQRSNKQ